MFPFGSRRGKWLEASNAGDWWLFLIYDSSGCCGWLMRTDELFANGNNCNTAGAVLLDNDGVTTFAMFLLFSLSDWTESSCIICSSVGLLISSLLLLWFELWMDAKGSILNENQKVTRPLKWIAQSCTIDFCFFAWLAQSRSNLSLSRRLCSTGHCYYYVLYGSIW